MTLNSQFSQALDAIAPLGHNIIALANAPEMGEETRRWVEHLDFVSSAVEQRPAVLVIPFSDIDHAQEFAAQAEVASSYRILCVCYHGAYNQEPELAGAMAAALADCQDPAVPFNGVNLGGIQPVADEAKLTFERVERALNAGVCVIQTGADGKPEIVRAVSTYRFNPDTGAQDDIMLDINGALTIDYVRKVMRTAAMKERRRKNTSAQRRNLRSIFLSEALKLEQAEILQNVKETANQLTVIEDASDRYRVNVNIPADWVRGMHVVATTLDVH